MQLIHIGVGRLKTRALQLPKLPSTRQSETTLEVFCRCITTLANANSINRGRLDKSVLKQGTFSTFSYPRASKIRQVVLSGLYFPLHSTAN